MTSKITPRPPIKGLVDLYCLSPLLSWSNDEPRMSALLENAKTSLLASAGTGKNDIKRLYKQLDKSRRLLSLDIVHKSLPAPCTLEITLEQAEKSALLAQCEEQIATAKTRLRKLKAKKHCAHKLEVMTLAKIALKFIRQSEVPLSVFLAEGNCHRKKIMVISTPSGEAYLINRSNC